MRCRQLLNVWNTRQNGFIGSIVFRMNRWICRINNCKNLLREVKVRVFEHRNRVQKLLEVIDPIVDGERFLERCTGKDRGRFTDRLKNITLHNAKVAVNLGKILKDFNSFRRKFHNV